MKREKRRDENKVEYGTISLPSPIIKKIKERIKGTGMNSVSAFVAYVLRQILSFQKEKRKMLSRESEEETRRRLKSLGY